MHTTPLWTFEIFWRRLLLGAVVTAVASYLALVSALFWWWDRNPHNQISWADFATAPVAWSDFRAKRGDTAIATALARLKAGDFVEAFHGLRAGLARSPGNVAGRIMLARLYRGSDPAHALATLEGGLPVAASEVPLLRALFAGYFEADARQRALDQSATLLAPGAMPAPGAEARAFLGLTRVALLLEREEAEAAAAELAALAPPTEPSEARRYRDLRLAVLLRLGRTGEAEALVREPGKAGARGPAEFRAAAELAVTREDEAALTSALRAWLAAEPDQPAPYLYAFQAWHRMKRLTQRAAAEQQFYAAFGGRDAALQLFAALAVRLDLPEAVQRARQVAEGSRLGPFAFQVLQTEIELRRGEFDAAFRSLRLWEERVAALGPAQRVHPEFVRRLVRACVAGENGARDPLTAALRAERGRLPFSAYGLALDLLVRAGQPETARAVAELGRRFYPYADALNLAAAKLAEPAATPAVALAALPALPGSGAAALETGRALLASESYVAARALFRAVRAAKPAWLPPVEVELGALEVELALAAQEPWTARAVVRSYLERHRTDEAALRLVAWAALGQTSGRKEQAQWVHDEVGAARGASGPVAAALQALNLGDPLAEAATDWPAARAALERWSAPGREAEAVKFLDYLRARPPVWAAEARDELTVREVRLRLALDQRTRALMAFRELVGRAGAPRAAAFQLVRDRQAAGDLDVALLLAREAERLRPGDPAAARLMREVETPASAPEEP